MRSREVKIPGHRLKQDVADRVHRSFAERIVPDMLPRLSPPFWGAAFEKAQVVDSSYLLTRDFLQHRYVLCLVNTALPKPAKKYQRPTYMCRSDALARTLTELPWITHGDFYVFDRTCLWFVAVLTDRIYQMDESGQYKLLLGGAYVRA